jgi:hypothetical protein
LFIPDTTENCLGVAFTFLRLQLSGKEDKSRLKMMKGQKNLTSEGLGVMNKVLNEVF